MAIRHLWHINEEWFSQLNKKEKTIEIRVGSNYHKSIKVGDNVTFGNYGENSFRVVRVERYNSFPELLNNESVSKILPGYSKNQVLTMFNKIYSRDEESLGVYAIELEKIIDIQKKIICASNLIRNNDHKLFSKFIAESYDIADWVCKDYPNIHELFWSKYVPGIFSGERQIIACYLEKEIAGVAILKKDSTEEK